MTFCLLTSSVSEHSTPNTVILGLEIHNYYLDHPFVDETYSFAVRSAGAQLLSVHNLELYCALLQLSPNIVA